jgi:hypothetical protein
MDMSRIGRPVFAAGIAGLGALSLIHGAFVAGLEPVSPNLAGAAVIARLSGLILLTAAGGLLFRRTARIAAIVLTAILFGWIVVLHAPKLAMHLRAGGLWTAAFETFALAGAAWLLAGMATAERTVLGTLDKALAAGTWLGPICFGVSLPVFGALHFIYHDIVAGFIPAWLPAPQFWAYFTGAAHAAAGIGILTRIQGRLAATLAGAMYASWVLILHIPRVLADIHNRQEWTSLFVATALTGAAWLVAGRLARSWSR